MRSHPSTTERREIALPPANGGSRPTVAVEAPGEAVMAADVRGQLVEWSPQAELLFGWPRSSVLGRTPASLLLPSGDPRAGSLDCARILAENGALTVRRFQLKVSHRRGGELPVELILLPVSGTEARVYILARDLRRLKQEEQALEARLLHRVTTLAAEANTFEEAVQCSIDVVCEMTGWPIGHAFLLPDPETQVLVSTELWHFPDDGDYRAVKDATHQARFQPGVGLPGLVWQTGEPAWIGSPHNEPQPRRTALYDRLEIQGAFGLPVKIKEETVAILEFYTREETAPDAQLLLAVQGVAAQVGRVIERKRAEEERARLAAIVDSSYDAVIGMTPQGEITSWNVGAERLYGYAAEEAVGRRLSFLIPEELGDEGERILETLKRARRLEQFETIRLRRDGRQIHVSLTASPIMNADGRVIGAAAIERDITGRIRVQNDLQKAKEAAEIANRAKSEFLANISHELRTPMNAIIGMTQLALSENLAPVVRDYLQTAEDSAHVLLHLLNDILDFSRFESGKFHMDHTPFQLRGTLAESVKTLSVRAREKELELACKVSRDVPDDLVGDPVRLGQVILNLAGNAVKFTEAGEVAVEVCVESRHIDEVCLHFAVRDTGIGISAEDQERIFAPFTQADSSTTRHFGGTGLGLAICQELIDLMDGRLWVESELGAGSTFHFTARFPLPSEEELAADASRKHVEELRRLPAPLVEDGADGAPAGRNLALRRPLRVLLAEDTPANQKVIKSIVEKRGHAIEVAQNGREAVDLFQRGGFDVVLMDVQMPLIDGFQATGIIRSMERSAERKTPIVAMTAHVMHGDRERCLAAGMDAYISKPIHPRNLIELIESLSNQNREAELKSPGNVPSDSNSETQNANCELAPADGETVFDLRATLRRLGGDENLLQDIVRFFLEDSPELLDDIRRGIERDDAEAVTRAAHSLKGLAANFGARDAVEAAWAVERCGRTDDLSGSRPGVDALARELDRLNAALKGVLAEGGERRA